MEEAPTRDIGGLGDIVQGRRLEAALHKETQGLGLNTRMGLRALALAQADWGRHFCTSCIITLDALSSIATR